MEAKGGHNGAKCVTLAKVTFCVGPGPTFWTPFGIIWAPRAPHGAKWLLKFTKIAARWIGVPPHRLLRGGGSWALGSGRSYPPACGMAVHCSKAASSSFLWTQAAACTTSHDMAWSTNSGTKSGTNSDTNSDLSGTKSDHGLRCDSHHGFLQGVFVW